MKYDGEFLKEVHNDIKDDMAAIGFKPHRSPQHLMPRFTYGCEFYTLRYWRSADIEWMTDHFYHQSCLELLVCNNRLFIGIWFGINNKELRRLKKHEQDIIGKRCDYPGYTWQDEKGTPEPTDEMLIKWLCESDHETTFRKELTGYSREEVITEMKHLSVYLDILLKK